MSEMTRAQFARHMGVSRSTVTRWIQAGRVATNGQGRIDPEAAARSLAATESPEPHHEARREQIAEQKAAQGQNPAGAPPAGGLDPAALTRIEQIGAALKVETYKLKKADAEIRAMERDKLAGTLGETERFEYVMRDVGSTLRALVEGMADRLAPTLAAHGGDVNRIHSSLQDAAHDLLNEISDHMQRKAESIKP